jgi:hypothetical protein
MSKITTPLKTVGVQRCHMPNPTPFTEIPAAQRQRLAYIEFRLWFYGEVSRKDVLDRFQIATAAGTRDMILYRDLAPLNLAYDRKVYRYRTSFQPLFFHPVDRVLASLTCGFGAGEPPNTGALLAHAVPARLNQPDLVTLSTVTRAIHRATPLQLTYHSMKTGAVPRIIVPHALVDSGLRWHVRAFDRTRAEFRDLVLTRMEQVQPMEASFEGEHNVLAHEQLGADQQWNRAVALDLVPHPAHPYPLSIEKDFGMQAGRLSVTLRAATAGYVLRQWQVDCSPDARMRGPEFRLWLADGQQLDGVDNAVLAPGYWVAPAE